MKLETNEQYELSMPTPEQQRRIEQEVYPRLRATLDRLGIPHEQYVIGGSSGMGALCIERDAGLWIVFVGERGRRLSASFFGDAWAAANYFVWELMRSNKPLFPEHPFVPLEIKA